VRQVVLSLTALLTLTCSACGSRNNLYPVSGMVTWKGAPASGATVFFTRQDADPLNEHLIMGLVQENGSFELVCGSRGKGAPPGAYTVTVEWKQVSGQGKGRSPHQPDRLNGRYADPRHPLLHATVEATTNHLPPFELSD
jgi:hypothetical protein